MSVQLLLRRTATVALAGGTSKFALLAAEFAFAGALGAAGYGAFAVCLALLLVVSNLTLLGLNYGAIQYLAKFQEDQRPDLVSSVIVVTFGIVAFIAAGAALAIGASASWVASLVLKDAALAPLVVVSAAILPLEALNQAMSAVFRGLRRYRMHVLVADLGRNAALLLSVPLVLAGMDLEGILLALGAGAGLSTLVGLVALSQYFTRAAFPGVFGVGVEVVRYSYLLFGWNVFQKIAGRGQVLLAGAFLTAETVGAFSLFTRLLMVFSLLQTAVNTTTAVEFAQRHHKNDIVGLRREFLQIAEILLAVAGLLALPLVVAPTGLISLFGPDYSPYAIMLVPLVVAQLFNVGTGPAGQLLINTGHQRSILVATILGSMVQVGASIILMPLFGLAGAVAAESATIMTLTLVKQFLISRFLGVHAFVRQTAILSATFVVAALSGAATAAALGLSIGSIVALLVYLCCLALTYKMRPHTIVKMLGARRARSPAASATRVSGS